MGAVYLARHEQTGTPAAVKLIRPEYAANSEYRARLRREVAAARRVPRFCTAQVLAADLDAEPPWVATEYIDGPTLDVVLLEQGPLSGAGLETFAVGVAVALRAIHQHGVIHRDLKPSNILLSPVGPRVIDFGIARIDDTRTQLTHTGMVVGTPAYMAPEQLGDGPITPAVDVFAWASLVTYAATGTPPFGTGESVRHAIVHEQPDLDALEQPLRSVVTGAFHKVPGRRPSASELVDQLSQTVPVVATRVLATAAVSPNQPAPPVAPAPPNRGASLHAVPTVIAPETPPALPDPPRRSAAAVAPDALPRRSNHPLWVATGLLALASFLLYGLGIAIEVAEFGTFDGLWLLGGAPVVGLAAAGLLLATRRPAWGGLLAGLLAWQWFDLAFSIEWLGDPTLNSVVYLAASLTAVVAQLCALIVLVCARRVPGVRSPAWLVAAIVASVLVIAAVGFAAQAVHGDYERLWLVVLAAVCGPAVVPLVGLARPASPGAPIVPVGWLLGGVQFTVNVTFVWGSSVTNFWHWSLPPVAAIAATAASRLRRSSAPPPAYDARPGPHLGIGPLADEVAGGEPSPG